MLRYLLLAATWAAFGGPSPASAFSEDQKDVNDGPWVLVPGAQQLQSDATLDVTGILLGDPDVADSPDGLLRVSLAVSSGALCLQESAGLSFESGSACGDAALAARASEAQWARALATLSYEPAGGDDTLVVTVEDPEGLSATASVAIAVEAVDSAPVLSGAPLAAIETPEDTPLTLPALTSTAANVTSVTAEADHGSVSCASLDSCTYQPPQDWTGFDAVRVWADGSDAALFLVRVTAVPDDPTVAAAALAFSGVEDEALALAGLSVADPDDGLVDLRLTATHGALSLGSAAGLQVASDLDGKALELRGGAALLTAALNTLAYTPDADWSGEDAVVVEGFDLALAVTIAPVNDAPSVIVPAAWELLSPVEDEALLLAGLQIADVDAGADAVQVSLALSSGALTLDYIPYWVRFYEGDGKADASMQFTGSLELVNEALENMRVEFPADWAGRAALTVSVNDLSSEGLQQTTTVEHTFTAAAASDAPQLVVPAAGWATLEDEALLLEGIAVADVDAATLDIDVAVEGGALVWGQRVGLSADDAGSVEAVAAALAALSFEPAADWNGQASLSLTITDVADGQAVSALDVPIAVAAVNDAPVFDRSAPEVAATDEDTPLALVGLAFSDVDMAETAGTPLATVSLAAAHGTLSLPAAADVLVSVEGQLFSGAVADVNEALAGLTYTPDADWFGDDEIEIVVSDQGHTGSGHVKTATVVVHVAVAPVDDAPELTVTDEGLFQVATADGDSAIIDDVCVSPSLALALAASASGDQDCYRGTATAVNAALASVAGSLESVSLSGGVVTQSFDLSGGALGSDDEDGDGDQVWVSRPHAVLFTDEDAPLSIPLLQVAEGVETFSLSATFGSLSLPSSADATFDGATAYGTTAALNALLDDGLVYTPPQDFYGVDYVQLGDEATLVVRVVPVADAVVVTTASANAAVLSTVEDAPLSLLAAGLAVVDVDDAPSVTLALSAEQGSLAFGSRVGILFLSEDGTVSGRADKLNAALPTLVYTPPADWSGTDRVSFGDVDLEIAVEATDDAPTVVTAAADYSIAEDETLDLGGAFEVADVDTAAAGVELLLAAAHGQLSTTRAVCGVNSDADCLVSALADLTYTPAADWHGRDSVTLTVGATGVEATIYINVAAVADAPVAVASVSALAGLEDTPIVFSSGVLSIVDVDGDMVSVSLAVEHGSLALPERRGLHVFTDSAARLEFQGTAERANAALEALTYTPDEHWSGTDYLALNDDVVVELSVAAVDDATVVSGPLTVQRIDEDSAFSLAGVTVDDIDAGTTALTLELAAADGAFVFDPDTLTADVELLGDSTLRAPLDALNAALAGASFVPDADFSLGTAVSVGDFTMQLHVVPTNDAPTLVVVDHEEAVYESTETALPSLVSVADADAGDVLTLSGLSADHFAFGKRTAVSLLEDGSLRGSAAALSAALSTLSVTLASSETFALTLTDEAGASATAEATVTVLPVNHAPVISAASHVEVDEDGSTGALGWTVADDDQSETGAMRVTVASSQGTTVIEGTLEEVNAELALFAFAPEADVNGEWFNDAATTLPGRLPQPLESIVVTATDADGASATQTVMVSVRWSNDAPTISAPEVVTAAQGEATLLTPLSLADVDVAEVWNGTLSVDIAATNGALGFSTAALRAAALSFSLFSDEAMRFSGPVDRLNTALATLTFTSSGLADGNVSVAVSDGGFSGPPTGEALSAEATIAVSVVPATPDAMVTRADGSSLAYVDEGDRVWLSGLALQADEIDLTGDERLQLRVEATAGRLIVAGSSDVALGDEHYAQPTQEVRLTADWADEAIAEVQTISSRVDYRFEVQRLAIAHENITDPELSFTYANATRSSSFSAAFDAVEIEALLETMSNIGDVSVSTAVEAEEWLVTFRSLAATVPLLESADLTVTREATSTLEAQVQTVSVSGGGSFRLLVDGDVHTDVIAHNATAAEVRTALEFVNGVALASVSSAQQGEWDVAFPTTAGNSPQLQIMWSSGKGSLACSACGALDNATVATTTEGTALLASRGTLTLSMGDETTAALPYSAPAGAMRAALAALDQVSWCRVTRRSLGPEGTFEWLVTFAAADGDVPMLQGDVDTTLVLDGRAGVGGFFTLEGTTLRADSTASQVLAAVPDAVAVTRTRGDGGQMTWTVTFDSTADVPALAVSSTGLTGSGAAASVVLPERAVLPGDLQVLTVATTAAFEMQQEVQRLSFWTYGEAWIAAAGDFRFEGQDDWIPANASSLEGYLDDVPGLNVTGWNLTGNVAHVSIAEGDATLVVVTDGGLPGGFVNVGSSELLSVAASEVDIGDADVSVEVDGTDWVFTFAEHTGDVDLLAVAGNLVEGYYAIEEVTKGAAPISGLVELSTGHAFAHDATVAELQALGLPALERWEAISAEYGYSWSFDYPDAALELVAAPDGADEAWIAQASSLAVREGTLASLNAVLASGVVFQPEPYWNSPRNGRALVEVTLLLDGQEVGSQQAAVHVNAVNDAPVLSFSSPSEAQEGAEDTPFVLGGLVTVSDPDVAENPRGVLYVTVAADHGTVSLPSSLGIYVTSAGEFAGTAVNVNAALAQLTVTPDADWHSSVVPRIQTVSTAVEATAEVQTVTAAAESNFTLAFETCTSSLINSATASADDVAAALTDDGCLVALYPLLEVAADRRVGGDTWTLEFTGGPTDMALLASSSENVTVAYDYFVPDSFDISGTTLASDASAAEVAAAVGGDVAVTRSSLSSSSGAFTWSVTFAGDYDGELSSASATVLTVQEASYEPLTIAVTVSDGLLSDSGALLVRVAAVEDDPVITLPSTSLVIEEDVGAFIRGISVWTEDENSVTATVSWTSPATVLTFEGTLDEVNAALGAISYKAEENFVGRDVLTVAVGASEAWMAIVSTAVDDEPVWSAPDAVFTTEDLAVVISGISVADPDADDLVTVSFASEHGGVSFSEPEVHRVLLSDDDGTIVGTLANVNAALATLVFEPEAHWAGETTLEVGDAVIAVTVAAADDAPTVSTPTALLRTDEDQSLAISSITVADPDASFLELELSCDEGSVAPASVSGTVAQVQLALEGLVYTPARDWYGLDRISVVVRDGAVASTGEALVLVSAVNDAPEIVSMTELASVDADDELLTVTLTGPVALGAAGAYGVHPLSTLAFVGPLARVNGMLASLEVTGSGTVTLTVEDAEGAVASDEWTVSVAETATTTTTTTTVVFPATVAVDEDQSVLVDIQGGSAAAVVNGVYTPASDFFGEDLLEVLDEDGNVVGEIIVTVAPVNDAPVVTSGDTLADVVLSDVDIGTDMATLTVEPQHGGSVDVVELLCVGGFSGTLAALNACLANGGIVYSAPTGWDGTDEIVVTVSDGELSASGSVFVEVTQPLDPVVTVPAGPLSVDEDTDLVVTGLGLSYWHADAGKVSVQLTAESGSLSLAESFEAAPEDAVLALASVRYRSGSNVNGRDVISLTVDGVTETVDVDVVAINDAPSVSAGVSEMDVLQYADAALVSGLYVVDTDAQESPGSSVLAAVSVTYGQLAISSTSGLRVAGQDSAALEFEGSLSSVNYALSSLTYYSDVGGVEDEIVVSVSDQGNTGAGGALVGMTSVAVAVEAVELPPEVSGLPAVISAVEDTMSLISFDVESVDIELEAENCAVYLEGGVIHLIGDSDWHGRTTLVITVDGGATVVEVPVVVASVADPPALSSSSSSARVETDEDVAVALPAVFIAPDDDDDLLVAVVSAASGTVWTDGSLAGLAVVEAGPAAAVELRGPAQYLETALASLWFQGAADASGDVAVTVTVDSVELVFTVAVAEVNDAPTVTLPSNIINTVENLVYLLEGVTVSDPDLGDGAVSVAVSVSLGAVSTAGSAEASDLAFSGTLDEVNLALSTLQYRADESTGLSSVVVITASDGAASSTTVVEVLSTPVADASVVSVADAVTDEDVPVVLAAQVSDQDADDDVTVSVDMRHRAVLEVQTVTTFTEHADRVQVVTASQDFVLRLGSNGTQATDTISVEAVATEEEETAGLNGESVEAKLRALGTGLEVEVSPSVPGSGTWEVTFIDAPWDLPELVSDDAWANVTTTIPASQVTDSFTLSLDGIETAELAADASALDVQTALDEHTVAVTRSESDLDGGYTWSVTFLMVPPTAVLASDAAHVSTAQAVAGFGQAEVQRVRLRASHVDMVQRINVTAPEGGWFSLSLDGETTIDIRYDAPATTADEEYWTKGKSIQSALEALSTVSAVTVYRQPTVFYAWIVTFHELSYATEGLQVESQPQYGQCLVETLREHNRLEGEFALMHGSASAWVTVGASPDISGLGIDAVATAGAESLEGGFDLTVALLDTGEPTMLWADTSTLTGLGHASDSVVLQGSGHRLGATLSVDVTDGVVFSGARSGTTSVTLTGPLARVNAALESLTYAPAPDWTGYADVTVHSSEQSAAGTVTVAPVDDLSVISAAVVPLLAFEDGDLSWLGLSVSDVDVGTSWVTVHARVGHGALYSGSSVAAEGEQWCTNGLFGPEAANTPCVSECEGEWYGGDGWCSTAAEYSPQRWGGCALCQSGEREVVLTGTLADVNFDLGLLMYRADAHWSGVDKLLLWVDTDGVRLEVPIEVSAINDSPVLVLDGFALTDYSTDASPRGVLTVDEDSTTYVGMVTLVDVDSTALQLAVAAEYGSTSFALVRGDVTRLNDALADLQYAAAADWYGTDVISLSVTDEGGATHAREIVVNVTEVADGPAVQLPAAMPLLLDEDTALVIEELWIDDVDLYQVAAGADAVLLAHSNTWVYTDAAQFAASTGFSDESRWATEQLTVDLVATLGVLTLYDSNVTFSRGDGARDEHVTFAGSIEAVNRALYGLTFIPDQDANSDVFGLAEIAVTVTDEAGLSDMQRVLVHLSPVNDAPLLVPVGAQLHAVSGAVHAVETQYVAEDASLALPVVVSDVDDLDPQFALVEVTVYATNGTVSLPSTAPVHYTLASSALLSFQATLENANEALAGLAFEGPAAGGASVTLSVDDGDGLTDSVTIPIVVVGVNDAPTLSAPDYVTCDEDGAALLSVVLSDGDTTAEWLSVEAWAAHGALSLGAAVEAGYEHMVELLEAFTYTPASDWSGDDAVVLVVRDAHGSTHSLEVVVEVEPVNDAPSLWVPSGLSTLEDRAVTLAGVRVSDPDADSDGEYVWVTLSASNGSLSSTELAGSVDGVNAALVGLVYTPALDFFGSDAIVVQVTDAAGESYSASVPVDVASVADAPVWTVPRSTLGVDEGYGLHVEGVSVWDADDDGAAEYELTLTAAHGEVTLTETSLNFTQGTGHTDSRIVASGSLALINKGLDQMHYLPSATHHGRALVSLTLIDEGGLGLAAEADLWLRVTSFVDDEPVLTLPGTTVVEEPCVSTLPAHRVCSRVTDVETLVLSEDETLLIEGVSVTDPDSDVLTLTVSCEHGSVALLSAAGLRFLDGSWAGGASLEAEGSVANLNAALSGLSYTPDADWFGDDSLVVTVGSASQYLPLRVWAVNDAPTLAGGLSTVQALEDTSVFMPVLSVADVDGDVVTLTVDVVGGSVRVAWASEGAGLEFFDSVDELGWTPALSVRGDVWRVNEALAGLEFVGDADWNGVATATFSVSDGSSEASRAVYVNVAAVNDAPVVVASPDPTPVVVLEDVPTFVGDFAAEDVDVDEDALPLSVVVECVHGSCTSDFWFTSDADYSGDDASMTVTFTDAGGLSDSVTVAITVEAVNDAPAMHTSGDVAYLSEGETVRLTGAHAGLSGSVGLPSQGSAGFELYRSTGVRPDEETTAALWKNKLVEGPVGPDNFAPLYAGEASGDLLGGEVMLFSTSDGALWRTDGLSDNSAVVMEALEPRDLVQLAEGSVYMQGSGVFSQWMLTTDDCGGLRSAASGSVFLAVSESNEWDSSLVYDCPAGYHALTTAEYAELGLELGDELMYWGQCGWEGDVWDGLARQRFRFLDSHETNYFLHAGQPDGSPAELDTGAYLPDNFAGMVCGEGDAGAVKGLWRSDGTWENTRRVASWPSRPESLVVDGSVVFMTGETAETGRELFSWSEAEGAQLVEDCWRGAEGGEPSALTVSGGDLFFSCASADVGRELFSVSAGGHVVDLTPGSEGSGVSSIAEDGEGGVYFNANAQLWHWNATTGAAQLVGDAGGDPTQLTYFDGAVYFVADRHLWWAADGDVFEADFFGGLDGTERFAVMDGRLYLRARRRLWRIDAAGAAVEDALQATSDIWFDPEGAFGVAASALYYAAGGGGTRQGLQQWDALDRERSAVVVDVDSAWVAVTASCSSGSLTVERLEGSVDEVNLGLRNVQYTAAATGSHGWDACTFAVEDEEGLSDARDVRLHVQDVNSAPTVALSASSEEGVLAVEVEDDGGYVQVTLSVPSGAALQLTRRAVATVVQASDAVVVVTGTVADVNEALGRVLVSSPVLVSASVSDLGRTGKGGEMVASASISM